MQRVRDINSAMGNASHTFVTLFVSDKRYAVGSRIISCLPRDTNIEKTDFPKAWNVLDKTTQYPAKIKLMLITLSAGMPISSIFSEALKRRNISFGNTCITVRPTSIMTTA